MTKEEAHKILCRNILPCLIGEWREAISIAAKALEAEPHWIPVEQALPEVSGLYLVTEQWCGYREVHTRYFNKREDGESYWSGHPNQIVYAWQPIPESFKGVTG